MEVLVCETLFVITLVVISIVSAEFNWVFTSQLTLLNGHFEGKESIASVKGIGATSGVG